MKFNKVTIICLAIAGLLTGGVMVAKATGFVTHEEENKIILWDNVRLVGQGLNISSIPPDPGNINIGPNKDLYIKKFIGFDCPNYPADPRCAVTLGDVGGNTFLKIGKVTSNNLTFSSTNGISIVASSIIMNGQLILTDGKNLIATTKDLTAIYTSNSVYTDNLKVNEIGDINSGTGLTLAPTKMDQKAFFQWAPPTTIRINYTPPCCTSGINLCLEYNSALCP